MEWVIIGVAGVWLAIAWSGNRASSAYYRKEIARLERKVDYLYRRFELDYAKEQGASIPARVRELALSGNKIEAIKVYREATGVGLKEAKDAVEDMIAREAYYPTQSFGGNSNYPAAGGPSLALSPEVMRLVEENKKIQAIKLYREQTNLSLKEAKDAVEVYEREIRLK